MGRASRRWTRITAVACIALGVAVVGVVATRMVAGLLRPPPLADVARLARVWIAEVDGNPRVDLSIPEMLELRARLPGVERFEGATRMRIVAGFDEGAQRLRGEAVTDGYFALLGVQPMLGRLPDAREYAPDGEPVALVSHATWREFYGADPDVLGRDLVTEERRFRIVGVLPPGFQGSIENDVVAFWVPLPQYLPTAMLADGAARQSGAVARLPVGSAVDALRGPLATVAAAWRAREPERYARLGLRAEPFAENGRDGLRGRVLLLGAMAALLIGGALLLTPMAIARPARRAVATDPMQALRDT